MYNLMRSVHKVEAENNIPTVGYQTLLLVCTNGAAGAQDYEGSETEADTLKAGVTINMSKNSDGSDPYQLDEQYILARTQADTKTAYVEIVLTDNYIASISLPDDVTVDIKFLTLPTYSEQ